VTPLEPSKFLKFYVLLRRDGLFMSVNPSVGVMSQIGTGFFTSREEAEMHRTLETLKLPESSLTEFFVFELEIPNPV
jgi:hypothetical protein